MQWPLIQGRLLFWLAALNGVPGMLYWTTDLWAGTCMPIDTTTSSSALLGESSVRAEADVGTSKATCRPLMREVDNRTGKETMLTNWEYATDFCAANGQNGDGTLVYPTASGPVASLRLANIRAGIEDWELFQRLGYTTDMVSHAGDLIRMTVVNDTSRQEDPMLLERLRREVARRVIAEL